MQYLIVFYMFILQLINEEHQLSKNPLQLSVEQSYFCLALITNKKKQSWKNIDAAAIGSGPEDRAAISLFTAKNENSID